jgi:hypothetical protein
MKRTIALVIIALLLMATSPALAFAKPGNGKGTEPASVAPRDEIVVRPERPADIKPAVEPLVEPPVEPILGEPPLPPQEEEADEPVSIWVDLHSDHVGTVSQVAAEWHFVLVGLPEGSGPGWLTADFKNAGSITLKAIKINQRMQHYVITLPAGDTLLGAHANVMLPYLDENVKLNLSSVTPCSPPPPPPGDEETCTPPPPPPSDDETDTPPPSDEESKTPPPPSNDDEDDDEVFIPEELPYTGGGLELLLTSIPFALTGYALRKRS